MALISNARLEAYRQSSDTHITLSPSFGPLCRTQREETPQLDAKIVFAFLTTNCSRSSLDESVDIITFLKMSACLEKTLQFPVMFCADMFRKE